MAVQEKEKMYIELRQILARQPGPELTEQLSEYKRSIKQKEWLHIEPTRKLGCVVDSILSHAKCGPNDHRKGAPPFIFLSVMQQNKFLKLE